MSVEFIILVYKNSEFINCPLLLEQMSIFIINNVVCVLYIISSDKHNYYNSVVFYLSLYLTNYLGVILVHELTDVSVLRCIRKQIRRSIDTQF